MLCSITVQYFGLSDQQYSGLDYKNYITILYNGANVCPVSSIAVSFIKSKWL